MRAEALTSSWQRASNVFLLAQYLDVSCSAEAASARAKQEGIGRPLVRSPQAHICHTDATSPTAHGQWMEDSGQKQTTESMSTAIRLFLLMRFERIPRSGSYNAFSF